MPDYLSILGAEGVNVLLYALLHRMRHDTREDLMRLHPVIYVKLFGHHPGVAEAVLETVTVALRCTNTSTMVRTRT